MSTISTQAVRLHSPNQATLESFSLPPLGPDEYLIDVKLRPVNPVDSSVVSYAHPAAPPVDTWPITPGFEGYGIVAQAGPGTSKFRQGDRVSILGGPLQQRGFGTWAEQTIAKDSDLVAVPDGVSDEAAAQFFVNPCTIFAMLQVLNLSKEQYLVISAANSTLARMAYALAKHYGFKTIGIVRRSEQKQEILDAGADVAISADSQDVTQAVRAATAGKGADAAIDCVAGEGFGALVASLKFGGHVLTYGSLAGTNTNFNVRDLIGKVLSVKGFNLFAYTKMQTPEDLSRMFATVMQLIEQKVLDLDCLVGEKLPLAAFDEALKAIYAPSRGRKMFLDSR